MAQVSELTISQTKKRADFSVSTGGFLSKKRSYQMRIVGSDELDEDRVGELVEQVFDRKSEWQQGKVNRYLRLNGTKSTAYILSESTNTDADGDDE